MRASFAACARCGKAHRNLEFVAFRCAVSVPDSETLLTHWALCPETSEPILLTVVSRSDDAR